jgi:hypothetical protein
MTRATLTLDTEYPTIEFKIDGRGTISIPLKSIGNKIYSASATQEALEDIVRIVNEQ